MTCTETYYPMWSARGIRGVKCERPAKWLVGVHRKPVCGFHARSYRKWIPDEQMEPVS